MSIFFSADRFSDNCGLTIQFKHKITNIDEVKRLYNELIEAKSDLKDWITVVNPKTDIVDLDDDDTCKIIIATDRTKNYDSCFDDLIRGLRSLILAEPKGTRWVFYGQFLSGHTWDHPETVFEDAVKVIITQDTYRIVQLSRA